MASSMGARTLDGVATVCRETDKAPDKEREDTMVLALLKQMRERQLSLWWNALPTERRSCEGVEFCMTGRRDLVMRKSDSLIGWQTDVQSS